MCEVSGKGVEKGDEICHAGFENGAIWKMRLYCCYFRDAKAGHVVIDLRDISFKVLI